MAKEQWTDSQKLAIKARGRDILVTASAGTGKTSVLTGRCIDLVAGGEASVREMLVLTFTRAAAEEMRSRIAKELRARYAAEPNPRLRYQLLALDAAHIGTIHSFCQRLIKEHFFELGIDPGLKLLDDDEQKLLKSRILEETLAWAWEQANLVPLLRELLSERNLRTRGRSFPQQVIAASDFLDGVVSRDDFCMRAAAINEVTGEAAEWLANEQKGLIAEKLKVCREQMLFAAELDGRLFEGGHWGENIRSDFLPVIEEAISAVEAGKMNRCAEIIEDFRQNKPKFKSKPKGLSDELRDAIKGPAQAAIETFIGLSELALLNPEYEELVAGAVSRQSRCFVELLKRFDLLYRQAKEQARCMDFADLEHYALRLLGGEDGPSEVALKLRKRFKYIFVDEYQDINGVQKRIISLLSAGGNTFAVGDIKQSIYSFRGAVPSIFLKDLEGASAEAAKGKPLRVDLSENWRSRQEVLDVANAVFERIMARAVAMIDYDERAMLEGLFPYEPPGGEPAAELHVLDKAAETRRDNGEENEEDDTEENSPVTTAQMQAAMIARRIRQLVADDGATVYERSSGLTRRARYSDIVILMRSLASANDYAEVLSLAGIPVHSQSTAGYFAATEIADVLGLLKTLDNPRRDIELAAVLRSPMFGVGDSDLARICLYRGRARRKNPALYEKLSIYAADGPDQRLRSRLAEVMATLERWREKAARGALPQLLWDIYRETGYLSFVGALPGGRQRRANLLDLHSRAIQFAGFAAAPHASLSAFVGFVEKLLEEGGDYKPADVLAPGENAVRIMSVHKSKGLEFPIVILSGLERRFNMRDMTGDCLADERVTIGLSIIEPGARVRSDSMAKQVIAERKRKAALAEEMRVLYVALTRAREKLILTGAAPIAELHRTLREAAAAGGGPLPHWMIARSRNPLQWLLQGLSGRACVHEDLGTDFDGESLAGGRLMDCHVHGKAEQSALAKWLKELKLQRREKPAKAPDAEKASETADALANSLTWRYPHEAATLAEAKTSVTAITHRGDEFRPAETIRSLARNPVALDREAGGGRIPAHVTGTATHLLMQSLDLSQMPDAGAAANTLDELVSRGAIPKAAAAEVDVDSVVHFWRTELGRLLLDNRQRLQREWPFTYAATLTEAGMEDEAGGKETIIVQGIVDMLLPLEEKAIVVDFKTDRVNENEAEERTESYRMQLALYGRAAGAILGVETVETCLHFLRPRLTFKL